MMTNTLPPRYVWSVGLFAEQMLLDLVQVQAYQSAIRYLALQTRHQQGILEPLVIGANEGIARPIRQDHALCVLAKTRGRQDTPIHQGEYRAIDDDRLEDLRYIQVQTVAPKRCAVQEADARVQMCAVDLG